MARNYSNLASSRSEYARALPGNEGGFRGVDFSSSPHRVALYRLPDAQNMYRDYRSEEGGALETIPGFRRIKKLDGRINGLFRLDTANGVSYIVAHAGTKLYLCREDQRDTGEWVQASGSLADNTSAAFVYNNVMYLLDGSHYKKLKHTESGYALVDMANESYAPVTWFLGEQYEQRNMLTNRYRTTELGSALPDAPEATQDDYGYVDGVGCYVGTDSFFCNSMHSYWNSSVAGRGLRAIAYKTPGLTAEIDQVIDTTIKSVAVMSDGQACFHLISSCQITRFSALEALYFCAGGGNFNVFKAEAQNESGIALSSALSMQGGKIYYDFPIGDFWKRMSNYGSASNYSDSCGRMLAWLPPNIVVKAGDSVTIGENFNLRDDHHKGYTYNLSDNVFINGSMPSSPSNNVIYIHNSSEDIGHLAVSAGASVPAGRYYAYLSVSDTHRRSRTVLWRIEVVPANTADADMPKPVQDVFEFNAKPLILHLPEPTESIVSVKDGEYDAGYGCYYDSDGKVTAIGVLARGGENEIAVEAVGANYKFRTGDASYAEANPDYNGTSVEAISGCKLCAVYDDRVFLAGNPALPNTVFYSARNDVGVNDPGYFGVLNYFNDGVGGENVTALFPFSDTLCVAKKDNVFYHQGADGTDYVTRVYPSVRGNAGVGSLGACCSFLDDPVMLTKEGVYGVNKETLTLERTLGRRSSTIDARLLREQNLSTARMVEWEGYLCLFVGGHVYMADSRAAYEDATGGMQYEWFYLCDIGVWRNASGLPTSVYAAETGDLPIAGEKVTHSGVAYALTETHEEIFFTSADVYDATVGGEIIRYAIRDGKAYAVYETGELAKEGAFHPAVCPMVVGDRLYFGADTGEVFVFNNDKRGVSVGDDEVEPSELHHSFYSFAGHRIDSGFLTRFDDCGVPHLCKSTSSRSLVLRVKLMSAALFTIGVSTERERDRHVDEISASRFSFAGTDFSALSFMVQSNATIVAGERERRWVEKQYLLRDGGFCRPFGVYNLTYRYRIAGRIRE